MIIDACGVTPNTDIPADVCIVGGGAAGIAIALQLMDTSLDVVLLESGGLASDAATQSLYAGESVGLNHVPLDTAQPLSGRQHQLLGRMVPLHGSDRLRSARPGCRAAAGL